MSAVCSSRDHAIVESLACCVRLLTVGQIARGWWRIGTKVPLVRRRLRRLVAAGLLRRARVNAHPLLAVAGPLLTWRPGEPPPDFEAAAHQARSRWCELARPLEVYWASPQAANLFGSTAGRLPPLNHRDHDLLLGQVYVFYRTFRPERAARWRGEAFDIYERESLVSRKWFPYRGGDVSFRFFDRRTTTMLYLGIDQHARQITISLRDEQGDVLQARQVSTQPEKIRAFFAKLTEACLREEESFIAVLEVCGFNDWLITLLEEVGCHKVILIQPEERKQRKTDRRDAAALSELLWVNRDRFLAGKSVRGLRQVEIAGQTDQENRRLTTLRKEASQTRTRLVNKIKHILRRHNRQWDLPTKTFPTQRAIAWLKQLGLPEMDRLEMDYLLADLQQAEQRLGDLEQLIVKRCGDSEDAQLLRSMPGVSYFTATSLSCRIGRVERFPRARSLANYWGLTPGCRNSGEHSQRLGHITKAGSGLARWLLAQVAHQALRKDPRLRAWYKRIKRRRGSTIARVAVMRKLATVIWQMLSKRQTYAECRAMAAA